MKPSVNVPHEKLAELLQASGSTLTPEQYAAAMPASQAFAKFPGRAAAAAWSKNILIFVTVISVLFALGDIGVENIVVALGLGAVTYFEIRVRNYFRELNPAAPLLGFHNQSAFAAGILVYGLYHAVTMSPNALTSALPSEYHDLIDAPTLQMFAQVLRLAYLLIGILGGLSQFALAWYYRNARPRPA